MLEKHITTSYRYFFAEAEKSPLKVLVKSVNGLRLGSLGVELSNRSSLYYGSLLTLLFFLKIRQMVVCSVRGTYNHV